MHSRLMPSPLTRRTPSTPVSLGPVNGGLLR